MCSNPMPDLDTIPATTDIIHLRPGDAAPFILPPLPAPPTTLHGREDEIERVIGLFAQPSTRLVTLTGPGGVGKTRIGLEVARRLAPAAFVPLGALSDSRLIVPAIESTLSVESAEMAPTLERVARAVAGQPLTLVLDTFEHLPDGGEVIEALLRACPELRLLVTSRVPIGLDAERMLAIPPLEIPGSFDAEAASPAVRLFADRAKAVQPGFHLGDHNSADIVAICRKLNGLPLAIELAAARSHLLAPHALAARLDRSLDLLNQGPRDHHPRGQTMRATIDWSYRLMPERLQRYWERLAVFVGSFDAQSAAAVAGTDDLAGLNAAGTIAELVRFSLLQPAGENVPGARFTMLDTMREFAWEHLEQRGERDAALARHAQRVLEFSRAAMDGLRLAEAEQWIFRTGVELPNIRQAIAWFRDQGAIYKALDVAVGFAWFWRLPRHIDEGRGWCEQLLAMVPGDDRAASRTAEEDQILMAAIRTSGMLASWQSDIDHEEDCTRQVLELSLRRGDPTSVGYAFGGLGYVLITREQFAEARHHLEESRRIGLELDDPIMAAEAANYLGVACEAMGRFDDAVQFHREAIETYEAAGFHDRVRGPGIGLATAMASAGNSTEAQALLTDLLATCDPAQPDVHACRILNEFAGLARASGFPEIAVRLFAQVSRLRRMPAIPMRPHIVRRIDVAIEDLRQQLGQAGFARLWDEGQRQSLGEAFALARSVQVTPAIELSNRERAVLALLGNGLSDREIAERLFISRRTASNHVSVIIAKLGVTNRTAAVSTARRRGMLPGVHAPDAGNGSS